MIIDISGHQQKNAVQNTALLFFPMSSFDFYEDKNTDGRKITSRLEITGDKANIFTDIVDGDKTTTNTMRRAVDSQYDEAAFVSASVYNAGVEHTGIMPQWGTITGIRPANFIKRQLLSKTCKQINEQYFTDISKIKLCTDVLESEKTTLGKLESNTASLYVSIPFCPSRCKYCSFVSHAIEKAGHLLEPYVEFLCKELELVRKTVSDRNLTINTIYIGGGTPTTLSAELLDKLMGKIEQLFDVSNLLEYTVEAGRPDTITRQKLDTIKARGAKRISVNPQTMNDITLEKIGRKHDSECFVQAYKLAREIGFDTINTDLIAGLEGENAEDFKYSLDKILELDPENVTVHTLSVKRAAYLRDYADDVLSHSKQVQKMLEYSQNRLELEGYRPYYLYRQKNMVGNLENVGYSKKGHEGLYNTYIMGEYQTIIAAGAGAVSKIVDNSTGRIERIFNYKYPYEYIDNFGKTIDNIDKMNNLIKEML